MCSRYPPFKTSSAHWCRSAMRWWHGVFDYEAAAAACGKRNLRRSPSARGWIPSRGLGGARVPRVVGRCRGTRFPPRGCSRLRLASANRARCRLKRRHERRDVRECEVSVFNPSADISCSVLLPHLAVLAHTARTGGGLACDREPSRR